MQSYLKKIGYVTLRIVLDTETAGDSWDGRRLGFPMSLGTAAGVQSWLIFAV
jgi:hypothetical protein